MKSYNYTIRDASGAMKKGSMDAPDRNAVLAELKRRGVVPVSVSEGTAALRPGRFDLKKYSIPALAVVALLIAASVWVVSETSERAKKGKTVLVKSDKKAKPDQKQKSGSSQQSDLDRKASPSDEDIARATLTNKTQKLSPLKSEGSVDVPTNGVSDSERNQGSLRTQTEQVLRMVESVPAGTFVPPPPPIGVADYAVAKTNIIVIAETDSVELADRKEKIAWLKQDIAQFVKEGSTPDDVIKVMVEHKNELAKTRTDCMTYLGELYKAGQDEEAAKFMEEANVELGKLGVTPLAHPLSRRLKQQQQP
jgi:hypothetical protein